MVDFDSSVDPVTGDPLSNSSAVSTGRWFAGGCAACMLLFAAINAASYFFRASDWSSLVSPGRNFSESLGFPLVMWEGGNSYGGWFVDYASLGWNVLIGFITTVVFGLFVARWSETLNRLFAEYESDGQTSGRSIQFSVRAIMVATLLIEVVVALAKNFAGKPETLIAIYTAGPAVLVAIAMLPQKLTWESRVAILIPATMLMIWVAVVAGGSLNMEFDKVLFGIFLCWTPQTALAAVGLCGWLLATAPGSGD